MLRLKARTGKFLKLKACLLIGLFAFSTIHADSDKLPPLLTDADFPPVELGKVELGRMLFFDPILSGNKNISCAACHHSTLASGDGLSLGAGEGGAGLGTKRTVGSGDDLIKELVPRNAPVLFNLGAKQIHTLFHDGRVMEKNTYANRFHTPAKEFLPDGLDSVLAAQSLFPVTSQIEMAGDPSENEVAFVTAIQLRHVWPVLADRVQRIDAYQPLFHRAFEGIREGDNISYVHIANALAAFIDFEWRSYDSPFDAYLGGTESALTDDQKAGMNLFYGKAGCSGCHSGSLQTDQKFHALALPQFGPGRMEDYDAKPHDLGRMSVTGNSEDMFRFRTPSLRNVELTGPYGHNGAYADLRGIVKHHLNPVEGLRTWDREQVLLPNGKKVSEEDFAILDDTAELKRLASKIDIQPVELADAEIDQVLSFLKALTGSNGRWGSPKSVPSGLTFD